MVDAAIEIAARYEQTMRAELGPEGARSLRAGLERVVTCC
jgi:hypothetical protein